MGTPELKISEAFVAILLLKSLPNKYSAIGQTTLASFETIKLSRIYTILSMESNRSSNPSLVSDTALAASSSSAQSKPNTHRKTREINRDIKCSMGHFGHTNEQCKIRRFREMEKDLAELKKERSAKPKQAKSASTNNTSDYWESAFACQPHHLSKLDIADTGSSSHMF